MKNFSGHPPRKLLPLLVVLSTVFLSLFLFLRPCPGADLIPEAEQVCSVFIRSPYAPERERPIPGGYDYQLEGEELDTFLATFHTTRFRRKLGGESSITGEQWYLLFEYEDGYGNSFEVTDELLGLRTLTRDKSPFAWRSYNLLDGELLELPEERYP